MRVLLDQQYREPFFLQGADRLPKTLNDDRREPFRWLVHDQAVGIRHQRTPDRQHLLLAAGQGLGTLVAALMQARKKFVDTLQIPAVTIRATLRNKEIFLNSQRRKYPPSLRDETHAATHCLERWRLGDLTPLEHDAAATRRIKADNRIDQRSLADAVAAKQAEDLALLEFQRQAMQNMRVAVIGVDVVDFEDRHQSVPR